MMALPPSKHTSVHHSQSAGDGYLPARRNRIGSSYALAIVDDDTLVHVYRRLRGTADAPQNADPSRGTRTHPQMVVRRRAVGPGVPGDPARVAVANFSR